MFGDAEILEAFDLDQQPGRRVPHTPPRPALRARTAWPDGVAGATTATRMEARCGRCDSPFEAHAAGFPHGAEGCPGFLSRGAVTLTARLVGAGASKGNRKYLANLQGALAPGSGLELQAPYGGKIEIYGHGSGRVLVVQDGETLLDVPIVGDFSHETKILAGAVLVSVCC